MAREHTQSFLEAARQVRDFEWAVRELQAVPILTVKLVRAASRGNGNDAAAVRRSLLSLYQKTPPHELGLPSDEYITGKVGGFSPKRKGSLWAEMRKAGTATQRSRLQLLSPATRPIRPTNASGETSFHLSFEAVNKNHTQYGIRTKSGRKARPDEHGAYLEDEEKRAHEMASVPIDPEGFTHYQEREQALAVFEQEYLFTNIKGGQEDRLELFRAAANSEPSSRPPNVTIDVRTQSDLVQEFLKRAWDDDVLAKAMTRSVWEKLSDLSTVKGIETTDADIWKVKFDGENGIAAYELLHDLGWRECFQNPKDYRSHGVEWDAGESGRIQMRVVGEIPHEIDRAGRHRFMKQIADRFDGLGVPYVLVMHRPTAENDEKNWHFHLIYWDRPAERFDPQKVREWLDNGRGEQKRYTKRCAEHFRAALDDPYVAAQAGRYDFEVEYTYVDKKGRSRTIRPFKQNKNRECTRKAFVPELREFVAEISNRELARVGAVRRVRAEKFSEFGIDKEPGTHLYDAANRQELQGRSTPEGKDNERKQWDYITRRLDQQFEEDKDGLLAQWSRMCREFRDAGKSSAEIKEAEHEWLNLKLIEARLRDQARRADQISQRLFSRPNAIANDSYNHLEAILNGTASPRVRAKKDFHLQRLEVLEDHSAGLKQLFRDELRLSRELESRADEVAEEARQLLARTDLALECLFFHGAGMANGENAKPASVRVQTADFPSDESTSKRVNQANKTPIGISKHLEKIANKRVPFTLVPGNLESGQQTLVAKIEPLDSKHYGLPPQVVAVTPDELSRLVEIHSARLNRGKHSIGEDHSPQTSAPVNQRALYSDNTAKFEAGPQGENSSKMNSDSREFAKRDNESVCSTDKSSSEVRSGIGLDSEPGQSSGRTDRSTSPPASEMPGDARSSPTGSQDTHSREDRPSNSKSGQSESFGSVLSTSASASEEGPSAKTDKVEPRADGNQQPSDRGITKDAAGEAIQTGNPMGEKPEGLTDVQTQQDRGLVRGLLERAERRDILVIESDDGKLMIRDAAAQIRIYSVGQISPSERRDLELIADEHDQEMFQLGDFVAQNSKLLQHPGWRDRLIQTAMGREIGELLTRWSSNPDFDRALRECVKLPTPDRNDAEDQQRRMQFFHMLMREDLRAKELKIQIEDRARKSAQSDQCQKGEEPPIKNDNAAAVAETPKPHMGDASKPKTATSMVERESEEAEKLAQKTKLPLFSPIDKSWGR